MEEPILQSIRQHLADTVSEFASSHGSVLVAPQRSRHSLDLRPIDDTKESKAFCDIVERLLFVGAMKQRMSSIWRILTDHALIGIVLTANMASSRNSVRADLKTKLDYFVDSDGLTLPTTHPVGFNEPDCVRLTIVHVEAENSGKRFIVWRRVAERQLESISREIHDLGKHVLPRLPTTDLIRQIRSELSTADRAARKARETIRRILRTSLRSLGEVNPDSLEEGQEISREINRLVDRHGFRLRVPGTKLPGTLAYLSVSDPPVFVVMKSGRQKRTMKSLGHNLAKLDLVNAPQISGRRRSSGKPT